MDQHSSRVKITPPKVSEVLLRKRLFKKLDEAQKRPITWIAAPGGAGKTTLVSAATTEANNGEVETSATAC